jgi:hypothetical protein
MHDHQTGAERNEQVEFALRAFGIFRQGQEQIEAALKMIRGLLISPTLEGVLTRAAPVI